MIGGSNATTMKVKGATLFQHGSAYRRLNGRLKIHALLYARIIVSSILNLAAALTACGTFAGSVIVSPDLTL